MKKILLICLLGCCCTAKAQEDGNKKNGISKAVEKTKKINQKTKEINDASNEAAGEVAAAAENVKNTVSNVKKILKIFEPILSFHFKKNKEKQKSIVTGQTQQPENQTNTVSANQEQPQYGNQDQTQSNNAGNGNAQTGYPQSNQSENSNANNNMNAYGTPENNTYNQDGTMNLGHQNNGQFGNCLNLLEAKVMGMGEAEEMPGKIDLIFFSQYGGLGYSFESPFDAPTINEGVGVKSWRERNETEIAETKLTIGQFEKITTNTSLINAVKNTRGFGASVYREKMDGRVFAINLQQDDKEVMALLAVYKQFGTAGSKGYLQIKIKVQGIDKNGDGYPDANAYMRQ
jgi:hypothetical protein